MMTYEISNTKENLVSFHNSFVIENTLYKSFHHIHVYDSPLQAFHGTRYQ